MKSTCLFCNEEFHYHSSQKTGKFCCNKHRGDFQTKQRFRKGSKFKHHMRLWLLEYHFKEVCSMCGIGNEWNGKPLTLQIDHINGDPTDNRLENLRVLCPNCHVQTETWGFANTLLK